MCDQCCANAGVRVVGNLTEEDVVPVDNFKYEVILPLSSQGKRRQQQALQAHVRNCSITVVAPGMMPT